MVGNLVFEQLLMAIYPFSLLQIFVDFFILVLDFIVHVIFQIILVGLIDDGPCVRYSVAKIKKKPYTVNQRFVI